MAVTVIAGTRKGAAILTRGSDNKWSQRFVLAGWDVTAAARDGSGRYYLAVANPIFGPVLFVSDDLETFTQLEAAPRYAPEARGNPEHNRIAAATDFSGRYANGGRFVDQIWKLHPAKDALYAGVSEAGLFISRDRGQSWQEVDGFNNHPERENWPPGFGGLAAHTILADPANPDRLWVGVSSAGFFRSDDGGKTWTQKSAGVHAPSGQCVHAVAHNPADPGRLFRQEHFGVYLSEDGGDSWQRHEDGLPTAEMSDGSHCSFGFPIVMDCPSGAAFVTPLNGDNFRMPHGGQLAVYRSDHGGPWRAMRRGLPQNYMAGVLRGALAADQASGVYFGTTAGQLFASADLGGEWHEIASGLPRIMCVEAFAA